MAEQLTTDEVSTLDRFRAKAREFIDAFNRLTSLDVPPALQSEYSRLYAVGNTVKNTVQALTRTVDTVVGAISSAAGYVGSIFGFNGVEPVQAAVRDTFNGRYRSARFGALPLIPIAAIVAAIAAMTSFISDVYLFERKVTEQKRLESQGVAPQQAAQIVNQSVRPGLLASVESVGRLVLFGAVLYFGWQAFASRPQR